MNVSCIKAIKSTYSAHRGSKTARKKRMNEYLEAEKEAGACEAAEHITGTTEEHSARKSRQAVAKRAHLSSSAGGSSQKKVRREPETKVPLQGASQPALGFAESEKEEEVDPPLGVSVVGPCHFRRNKCYIRTSVRSSINSFDDLRRRS